MEKTEGAELAIIEQEPKEVITRGRAAATELTKIVSSREKKLVMSGKQYLFFEDWQTIGRFYGVSAKIIHTEELQEDGKLIGFFATAVALHNGQEVSGADAECTYDEPNWKSKPRFQLRSMAQTRACAKALRNCLGWVAVLAGYEATPAEEMADMKPSTKPQVPKTKVAEETSEKVFKNVGELLTECMKNGIQRQAVLDFIGVSSSNEITDLQEAWRMIRLELIKVSE